MGKVNYTVSSLFGGENKLPVVSEDASYVQRIFDHRLDRELYEELKLRNAALGVTDNFRKVIDYFKVAPGETPAGFRVEYNLVNDGLVCADLVRDISYDKNGVLRPQNVLFSADSANPYEIEPMKNLISNLTCNPAIIYNQFINNPGANIGGKYRTRDEVLKDIGEILGPGCDISVELNDPFGSSESEILEEAARFKELLSEYRVVIKVPHTGPVNADNVSQLMTGDKRFSLRYNQGGTRDFYRGHNLALMLKEHGYRVNFTLMFEPYQTALALQARPYFINSFIMFRHSQSMQMAGMMKAYEETGDPLFIEQLQKYMVENDYLSAGESNGDRFAAYTRARDILRYRGFLENPAADGLDGIRHNLNVLSQANLPDSRLIICNMQGENYYPYIDRLLMSPEYADMTKRVVITAGPELLAQFTSNAVVLQFHRRFMNAANGAK
ncbi:MAG: transaldolase [Clostridia bacterium]|nr:MAG: transaldolase [Clostridia bacterium]